MTKIKSAVPEKGTALRLSKKSVIVKIDSQFNGSLLTGFHLQKWVDSKLYSLKTSLLRKNFDLLRNSRPTVPMYADGVLHSAQSARAS